MADGPYTTISQKTWTTVVRALDGGDPDAMDHAYDELMKTAPPGWGDALDGEKPADEQQDAPQ